MVENILTHLVHTTRNRSVNIPLYVIEIPPSEINVPVFFHIPLFISRYSVYVSLGFSWYGSLGARDGLAKELRSIFMIPVPMEVITLLISATVAFVSWILIHLFRLKYMNDSAKRRRILYPC